MGLKKQGRKIRFWSNIPTHMGKFYAGNISYLTTTDSAYISARLRISTPQNLACARLLGKAETCTIRDTLEFSVDKSLLRSTVLAYTLLCCRKMADSVVEGVVGFIYAPKCT